MKRSDPLIHSLVCINSRSSHFMEGYEFKEVEVIKVFGYLDDNFHTITHNYLLFMIFSAQKKKIITEDFKKYPKRATKN